MRQILLVARRSWLVIAGLMLLVGGGSGYWSYSQAANSARIVKVDSVISLPSVDFVLLDSQSLFARSVASIESDAPTEDKARSSLVATVLGGVEDGRRSLVQFSVQSPSGDLATAAMAQFLVDLGLRVKARYPKADSVARLDELENGITEISSLLRDIRAQPPSTDSTKSALNAT